MANHKSALKRHRQNVTKNKRNTHNRSVLKNVIKKVHADLENKSQEDSRNSLRVAEKTISKIASKGVIHKRAAARKISQLARQVHQLSTTS